MTKLHQLMHSMRFGRTYHPSELAITIQLNEDDVKNMLELLERGGLVEKTPSGRYKTKQRSLL
jgi:DNA-binding IclR family transcriptional regulator